MPDQYGNKRPGYVQPLLDSQGHEIPPSELKYRNKAEYEKWQNESMTKPFSDAYQQIKNQLISPEQDPNAPPPSSLDPYEIARKKAIGDALMKKAAQQEQTNQQVDQRHQELNAPNYQNNYDRIMGNSYNEPAPQPGQVSDEDAANLASEFTKQPPRFNKLKQSIGNK